MRLEIGIVMDNAAFEDQPMDEVARILKKYIQDIENGKCPEVLRDINGNIVGAAVLVER